MSVLEGRAAAVIESNKYLTLATVDAAGTPWATPVYFTPDGHTDFYWVSAPEAQHSRNIAGNATVSVAIFDSSVAIGQATAVYLTAQAKQVPDDELADRARFFAARLPELREFTVDELSGAGELRLYRATMTRAWTLVRGGDPEYGTGIDSRHPVWVS